MCQCSPFAHYAIHQIYNVITLNCQSVFLIKCSTKLDNNEFKSNQKVHVLSQKDEDELISDFYKYMNPNNSNAEFITRLHSTSLIENVSLNQKVV